jgi:Activator of Hsp90 ATPase homolog 1-like protein
MARTEFIYVAYIRTTPEKLWEALTSTKFTKQYWAQLESDWRPGSSWKLTFADGSHGRRGRGTRERPAAAARSQVAKRIQARTEGRRLHALYVRGRARGRDGEAHRDPRGGTPHKLIEAVSQGWPRVLSSLKSLLETGHALTIPMQPPMRMLEALKQLGIKLPGMR